MKCVLFVAHVFSWATCVTLHVDWTIRGTTVVRNAAPNKHIAYFTSKMLCFRPPDIKNITKMY